MPGRISFSGAGEEEVSKNTVWFSAYHVMRAVIASQSWKKSVAVRAHMCSLCP